MFVEIGIYKMLDTNVFQAKFIKSKSLGRNIQKTFYKRNCLQLIGHSSSAFIDSTELRYQ